MQLVTIRKGAYAALLTASVCIILAAGAIDVFVLKPMTLFGNLPDGYVLIRSQTARFLIPGAIWVTGGLILLLIALRRGNGPASSSRDQPLSCWRLLKATALVGGTIAILSMVPGGAMSAVLIDQVKYDISTQTFLEVVLLWSGVALLLVGSAMAAADWASRARERRSHRGVSSPR